MQHVYLVQSSTEPLTYSDYTLKFNKWEEIHKTSIILKFPDCMKLDEKGP